MALHQAAIRRRTSPAGHRTWIAVLAALAIPAAHADTYTLAFTPTGGSTTDFTLSSGTDLYSELFFANVPVNGNPSSYSIDLLNQAYFPQPALSICSSGSGYGCAVSWVIYGGPQLYGVNADTPTVGTFDLTGNGGASVTITDDSDVAATPEPSSLALLGTGVLGLAGVIRRKLRV